jgi:hypothetical protein
MTLNKPKTHLLNAFNLAPTDLEKALYSMPQITTGDYNDLVDEIATWKSAYDLGQLYGTNENNSTFLYDGIDQFPVPPKR